MNELEEIQSAIERLSSGERANLAAWLRHVWGETGDSVAEPASAYNALPGSTWMTVEEYLEFERASPTRHEYIGGEVVAMTGGSLRHAAITRNLGNAMSTALRGKPCQVFMNDVKVRLQFSRDEIFYYPDVVVACGRLEMEKDYLREPKLIVEVLSPSTQITDRREKALHYRQIRTLEEYVLVAQKQPELTIYRRKNEWKPQVLETGEAQFQSIELSLPIQRIYDEVF